MFTRTPGLWRRLGTALAVTLSLLLLGAATANADPLGVDTSHYQHRPSLDWSAVKSDGVDFAFLKATEGVSFKDPYLAADWVATQRVGIFRGAYHFARPSRNHGDARAEARFFVHVAGTHQGPGDLPPVLDLETSGGLGVRALTRWVATWLHQVENLTGRTPIVYVSPAFWEHYMGNSTAFHHYPLWVAHYGVSAPRVPGGWPRWTFWQGRSDGHVTGISGNVDMDAFNGTRADLKRLANLGDGTDGSATTPSQPTTSTDSQANAAVATTVSATLDASEVWADQPVTISGTLTSHGRPLPDRRVNVFRKVADSTTWASAAVLRTDAKGRYAATFAVSDSVTYQARFPGTKDFRASRATPVAVTLLHQAETTPLIEAARASITRGDSVRLFGHLTTMDGTPVTGVPVDWVERYAGDPQWHPIGMGLSIAPSGWIQTIAQPDRTAFYKATFAGTQRFAAGASAVIKVTVN